MFKKNSDGIYYTETTMRIVRDFPGWQDDLGDIPDDREVLVHEDGSVNDVLSGDLICEASTDYDDEWLEYFDFDGFSRFDLGDLSSDLEAEMEKYQGNIAKI